MQGGLKEKGLESQGLDLLGRKESFNTQVGAASTKVRIKNAKPIQPMDMMGAMVTYTTDMEWFAAMGPTIRDIDKLFSNPLMRNAIENVAGESTMRLIDHHNEEHCGERGEYREGPRPGQRNEQYVCHYKVRILS